MRQLALLLCSIITVTACSPTSGPSTGAALFVLRLQPSALLQLDSSLETAREIDFSVPAGCDVQSVRAAPHGFRLAIELTCGFGSGVLWLDARSGLFHQPVTDTDSHFLAWSPDGTAMYLRIDSVNHPHVVRQSIEGSREVLPIDEFTYDLAPHPGGEVLLYTLSRGMGHGSEMWIANSVGKNAAGVLSDSSHYLSLARWSPDGGRLAFIKIPDTTTPFTEGELWVANADAQSARLLGNADAGHGFAPAWSPAGNQIAYVLRENGSNPDADMLSDALISNLYVVNAEGGSPRAITGFKDARVEEAVWHPEADAIAFGVHADDRIAVYVLNLVTGAMQRVPGDSLCCAAWLRE